MDVIMELIKAALSVGFIIFVLFAIATLFIVVFEFATDMDNRLNRK
jgi:hypothetical protein